MNSSHKLNSNSTFNTQHFYSEWLIFYLSDGVFLKQKQFESMTLLINECVFIRNRTLVIIHDRIEIECCFLFILLQETFILL